MARHRQWFAFDYHLTNYTTPFGTSTVQRYNPPVGTTRTNMTLIRSLFWFRFQSVQLNPDLTTDLQPWPYTVVFSWEPSPTGNPVNETEWQPDAECIYVEPIEWVPMLNTIGGIQTVVYVSPGSTRPRESDAQRKVGDPETTTLVLALNWAPGADIPVDQFTFIPVIGWMWWRGLYEFDETGP